MSRLKKNKRIKTKVTKVRNRGRQKLLLRFSILSTTVLFRQYKATGKILRARKFYHHIKRQILHIIIKEIEMLQTKSTRVKKFSCTPKQINLTFVTHEI